eukprot:2001877-Rhodomonas_salina.1
MKFTTIDTWEEDCKLGQDKKSDRNRDRRGWCQVRKEASMERDGEPSIEEGKETRARSWMKETERLNRGDIKVEREQTDKVEEKRCRQRHERGRPWVERTAAVGGARSMI